MLVLAIIIFLAVPFIIMAVEGKTKRPTAKRIKTLSGIANKKNDKAKLNAFRDSPSAKDSMDDIDILLEDIEDIRGHSKQLDDQKKSTPQQTATSSSDVLKAMIKLCDPEIEELIWMQSEELKHTWIKTIDRSRLRRAVEASQVLLQALSIPLNEDAHASLLLAFRYHYGILKDESEEMQTKAYALIDISEKSPMISSVFFVDLVWDIYDLTKSQNSPRVPRKLENIGDKPIREISVANPVIGLPLTQRLSIWLAYYVKDTANG